MILFKERFSKIEDMKPVVELRYFLFMMGFFAVFCGLLYNDFMSLPLYLWKSCYQDGNGVREPDCVYPVGIDPAWYGSSKEINYINSLKMKISVILGVAHMTLGICNKGLNARFFKNDLDFYHEFIP